MCIWYLNPSLFLFFNIYSCIKTTTTIHTVILFTFCLDYGVLHVGVYLINTQKNKNQQAIKELTAKNQSSINFVQNGAHYKKTTIHSRSTQQGNPQPPKQLKLEFIYLYFVYMGVTME